MPEAWLIFLTGLTLGAYIGSMISDFAHRQLYYEQSDQVVDALRARRRAEQEHDDGP